MIRDSLFKDFSAPFTDMKHNIQEQINERRNHLYYKSDKKVLNEDSDLFSKSGKFTREVNGINDSGLFIKGSSKSLNVAYIAAIRPKRHNYFQPVIPRWSYARMYDGCFLGLDDPMYLYYTDLRLGWFWGDENQSYLRGTFEIINEVLRLNNISEKDIVFFSSSGGGYASILASIWYPHTLSISINPQIILNNSPSAPDFEKITGHSLTDDKLGRNNLPGELKNTRSRHLIIFNADSQSDLDNHLLPLLEDFKISIGCRTLAIKRIEVLKTRNITL